MNYKSALAILEKGGRVRLPEWTGYWFKQGESAIPGVVYMDFSTAEKYQDMLLAFSRTGTIEPAWDENRSEGLFVRLREDWEEVTTPGLGFDWAILALKAGRRVARIGWNGKGMWLIRIHPGNAMHTSSVGAFPMQPCFGMKTAGNDMQPGWLASQADMFAEDWVLAQ